MIFFVFEVLGVPGATGMVPTGTLSLQNDSPETGDEVKKNPVTKYFFIMEKNNFEKSFRFFFGEKKSKNYFFE